LGAGRARGPDLAERRLDEVHRGKDLPAHAEATLRLAVIAQEPFSRLCRTRSEGRERSRRRRRQTDQRPSRGEHIACICVQLTRKPLDDRLAGLRPREPQGEIQALLVERPKAKLARRPWSSGGAPDGDCCVERLCRGREALSKRCGAGWERSVRRRRGRWHGKRGSGSNEGDGEHRRHFRRPRGWRPRSGGSRHAPGGPAYLRARVFKPSGDRCPMPSPRRSSSNFGQADIGCAFVGCPERGLAHAFCGLSTTCAVDGRCRRACHSFRRSAPMIHTSPGEPSPGFSR
jgi:hypothetical protein